jgi:hypothetical protein
MNRAACYILKPPLMSGVLQTADFLKDETTTTALCRMLGQSLPASCEVGADGKAAPTLQVCLGHIASFAAAVLLNCTLHGLQYATCVWCGVCCCFCDTLDKPICATMHAMQLPL